MASRERVFMQLASQDAEHRPTDVDVCICTYGRPSLGPAVHSVLQQRLPAGVGVRLLVIDNAERPSCDPHIPFCSDGIDITVLHAPHRNISIARNAALGSARAAWIAFLDDDEIAEPTWLGELLHEAEKGWDVVLGPVNAVYPQGAPRWMVDADLHSTKPTWKGGRIFSGYAGNVLLRRQFIVESGLVFDLALGRTGGEDLDFFHRLQDRGGTIGFAPGAIALEPVQTPRLHWRWLSSRWFRNGQSHGARLAGASLHARSLAILVAAAKGMFCLAAAPLSRGEGGPRTHLLRGVFHLGVVARLFGFRPVELY